MLDREKCSLHHACHEKSKQDIETSCLRLSWKYDEIFGLANYSIPCPFPFVFAPHPPPSSFAIVLRIVGKGWEGSSYHIEHHCICLCVYICIHIYLIYSRTRITCVFDTAVLIPFFENPTKRIAKYKSVMGELRSQLRGQAIDQLAGAHASMNYRMKLARQGRRDSVISWRKI